MRTGEIWIQNNDTLRVRLVDRDKDGWHIHNLTSEYLCLFMDENGEEGRINCISEEILRAHFHKDWSNEGR